MHDFSFEKDINQQFEIIQSPLKGNQLLNEKGSPIQDSKNQKVIFMIKEENLYSEVEIKLDKVLTENQKLVFHLQEMASQNQILSLKITQLENEKVQIQNQNTISQDIQNPFTKSLQKESRHRSARNLQPLNDLSLSENNQSYDRVKVRYSIQVNQDKDFQNQQNHSLNSDIKKLAQAYKVQEDQTHLERRQHQINIQAYSQKIDTLQKQVLQYQEQMDIFLLEKESILKDQQKLTQQNLELQETLHAMIEANQIIAQKFQLQEQKHNFTLQNLQNKYDNSSVTNYNQIEQGYKVKISAMHKQFQASQETMKKNCEAHFLNVPLFIQIIQQNQRQFQEQLSQKDKRIQEFQNLVLSQQQPNGQLKGVGVVEKSSIDVEFEKLKQQYPNAFL